MTTYVIGDVQGCYNALLRLLDKIAYDPNQDVLWFTGDLVNRGKYSLETLRFVKSLDSHPNRVISVLGNHDLGMLAVAEGAYPYDPEKYTFKDILDAPDREELLTWLQNRPLLHHDDRLNMVMVHAGIYPLWRLEDAKTFASEVEHTLRDKKKASEFFPHLFGNTPTVWDPTLQGFDRLRFICNAFLRMRFCNANGVLDLTSKEAAMNAPEGFMPWFKVPNSKMSNSKIRPREFSEKSEANELKIVFGHWAALRGVSDDPNVFPLDTGCVWGGFLTALKIVESEDNRRISEGVQLSFERVTVPCDAKEVFEIPP